MRVLEEMDFYRKVHSVISPGRLKKNFKEHAWLYSRRECLLVL